MDGIDRYNHTYAVVFFLFLALISFLVPKGPLFPRKVKATCWTPAEFDTSQVIYTNKICTEIANGSPDDNGKVIYFNDDHFAHRPPKHHGAPPEKESPPKIQSFDPPGNQTTRLVGYKTPLVLLLLGLCLKLPHLLWALASNASSSVINVDKVLGSYLACQASDPATQRQVHQDTAQAVADSVRLSTSTTSALYLFMKVMSILVVTAEILCLNFCVLSEIEKTTSSSNPLEYPYNVQHCLFTVKEGDKVKDYTVQCILTYEEDVSHADTRHNPVSPADQAKPSGTVLDTLLLYQALFTAVIAVLAVLLFANVVNTIGWFIKLVFSSNRTSLGLPSNAAMDLVLLVHMARINAGPGVARALAGNPVFSSPLQEGNREALMKAGVS